MFRMIIKDFRAFSHILIFQALIILGMMSFGIFVDHNGNLTVLMLIIYPMALPTVLLLSDVMYERLILSMPVSRLSYVLSKYIGGILMAFLTIGIGLLYSYVISQYKATIEFESIYSFAGLLILGLPVILSTSFLFPVYFRFSKARASGIMIILFTCILLTAIFGFVFLEKSITSQGQYRKEDVFPVIRDYITTYVQKIGSDMFITQVVIGALTLLLLSIGLSLLLIYHKDVGGES